MADKKLHILFGILVFAFCFQLYLKQAAASGPLGYRGSWQSAVEEAEESGKPIMVVFSGEWCPACRIMEESIFVDERITSLAPKFVTVKIDPRDCKDAAEFKETQLVPEIVFLSSDLKMLGRMEDRSIPGIVSLMNEVLEKASPERRRR
jgi:thiol:disulfide interchange protein